MIRSSVRGLGLALLLIAAPASAQVVTCLPPACVNNVVGKTLMLANGPSVRLVQAVGGDPFVVDPANTHVEWDVDLLETAQDATVNGTLPCPPPHADVRTCSLVTPTLLAAASMTYRAAVGLCRDPACDIVTNTTTVISPTVVMVNNVSCTLVPAPHCFTPNLLAILPNLGAGGSFRLLISRERLPNFPESAWSDPVRFVVSGAGTPPPPPAPIACVVSPFGAWSVWTPLVPPVTPPREQRIRLRDVIIPAQNGGAACPALMETDVRAIVPVITCPYVAPGQTVTQQRPFGDVIAGINQIATQATRWPLLLGWGWQILAVPETKTTIQITATCVGPK